MDSETGKNIYKEKKYAPPQFFQHEDLIKTFDAEKTLGPAELTNIIHHHHFTGSPLFVLLQHPVYKDKLLAQAHPEPCLNGHLECRWHDSYHDYKLEVYQPLHLVILADRSVVYVPLNITSRCERGFTIQIPEKSFILNQRQTQRYPCKEVSVELIQSDFIARAELMEFSSGAFRIRASSQAFQHNNWFNPDAPATLRLFSDEKLIYSELCRCIRLHEGRDQSKEIIFATEDEHISRFPKKKIRNPRQHIAPALIAVFEHPFTKRKVRRNILELSTTGFSIVEKFEDDLLMPGLMIHDLSIHLAGIPIANCTAQVIYKRATDGGIQHGIAVLDTDIHSYTRINRVICLDTDPPISISGEIDMDALWEFFFQTGFIYPEKYASCMTYRENFLNTYRKLYLENPEIARHITCEKNGRIYAHISMIRAYERTWLIHHHAARPMGSCKTPGAMVLRQAMIFLNGMYQLSSANMDYVICYFRPENKFPDYVFGGFARDFNNPQACSLDLFSYLSIPLPSSEEQLPRGWLLQESTPADLLELEQFYKYNSGGLFPKILRFGESHAGSASLGNVFEKLGFKRKWGMYSLIFQDRLKAVFVVDQSDLAINMSNLLNSIKVFIIDDEGMHAELLSLAAATLGRLCRLEKIILLFYPASAMQLLGIPPKKQYHLWILNCRYSNQFMEYSQKHLRIHYD